MHGQLSHVWLPTASWTGARQTPPSTGFPGQECWSRLPDPVFMARTDDIRSLSSGNHFLKPAESLYSQKKKIRDTSKNVPEKSHMLNETLFYFVLGEFCWLRTILFQYHLLFMMFTKSGNGRKMIQNVMNERREKRWREISVLGKFIFIQLFIQ